MIEGSTRAIALRAVVLPMQPMVCLPSSLHSNGSISRGSSSRGSQIHKLIPDRTFTKSL